MLRLAKAGAGSWEPLGGWLHWRCCSTSCLWQVSSLGRVRSATGVVSYGSSKPSGYRVVQIQQQEYSVHRLVAAAFLDSPPTPDHCNVNHIDRDPSNNHVANLEYVTPAENVRHSWNTNAGRRSNASEIGKRVLWRPRGESSWRMSISQSEVAKHLGLSRRSVSHCCCGGSAVASASGIWYEFKFADLQEDCQQSDDETWLPATYPGRTTPFSGLLVSTSGRVRFTTRSQARVTFGHCGATGYHRVNTSRRSLLVHRLVATTFLGQPRSLDMQVNHKDRDRGNNNVSNLEFVTPSQNVLHFISRSKESGERMQRSGKAVHARPAGCHASWELFSSMAAAALHTGVPAWSIAKLWKGQDVDHPSWEFKIAVEELLPDEEWRPVHLEGARSWKRGMMLKAVPKWPPQRLDVWHRHSTFSMLHRFRLCCSAARNSRGNVNTDSSITFPWMHATQSLRPSTLQPPRPFELAALCLPGAEDIIQIISQNGVPCPGPISQGQLAGRSDTVGQDRKSQHKACYSWLLMIRIPHHGFSAINNPAMLSFEPLIKWPLLNLVIFHYPI